MKFRARVTRVEPTMEITHYASATRRYVGFVCTAESIDRPAEFTFPCNTEEARYALDRLVDIEITVVDEDDQ